MSLGCTTAPALAQDRQRAGSAEAVAAEASATESPATGAADNPVYPGSFYAPFQPQTAFDMLERTPGFTVDAGDYVRGFGGAAGNVLINGQRPTVKAGNGITDVLRRIPAGQVERIVLLRGGGDVAQAAGQALVANVVLKADAAGSGTLAGSATLMPGGLLGGKGSISYNRKVGGWQTNVELSAEYERERLNSRYIIRDGAGTPIETLLENLPLKSPEAAIAASASRSVGGGDFTINGRFGIDEYSSVQAIVRRAGTIDGPVLGSRQFDYAERYHEAELGADWTRSLGRDWTTKLVALVRQEGIDIDQDDRDGARRSRSRQSQKPLEAVMRATVVRGGKHRVRPEIGGEIAYNRLASTLDYAEDAGTGLVEIPLPGADTRAAEWRGEAFANLTATLRPGLALEAGLAVELSRITVTGDQANRQDLSYLKPSAALVWNAGPKTQVRLAIRRTVDQLDFSDFAASTNVIDDRPIGGNALLRPTRKQRASLRVDHRWGTGSAIAAEGFHEWRSGVLGFIALPDGGQALGAIGDGRVWGLSAQATLALGPLVPGGQVKFDGLFQRSDVLDLALRRSRPINGVVESSWNAEFRQDLDRGKMSWGVRYVSTVREDYYFVDEDSSRRERGAWAAYLESTAIRGVKTTLTVNAINGLRNDRLRRFFANDLTGPVLRSEDRVRKRGASMTLGFSKAL
ncbi:TonB-dependent receptor [Novosphingobium sp. PS1R-30]|uniref:TonB-dependent receptor n=1 Tax=Novosphingobium anseongense TaxID=3133436 RepID=A0ABU8RUT9_9SPHN